MSSFARHERSVLCDLLTEVGPDAPTLCEGWSTADLAAHLVLRERRPDAAVGIVFSPMRGHTERVQRQLAARPWPDLVAQVRSGPPLPLRPVDEAMNTAEYFIHVEDVRRAGAGAVAAPRSLEAGLEQALGKRLKTMARMTMGKAPVPLLLEAPGFGEVGSRDRAVVTVTGPPSELTLFVAGREAVARVEFSGPADAVAQVRDFHPTL
jgi:uncharacterized protein (TIGR03085 family)